MSPTHEPVAVIGSGTMGSGIAQVVAMSGVPVILIDRSIGDLERGVKSISSSLERLQARQKIGEATVAATMSRLETSTDISTIAPAVAVIEAVYEDLEVKRGLIQQIDEFAPSARFVASNTSSISLTSIAAGSTRPDRVVGMHFFNPVPILSLVEIVVAIQSSDDAVQSAVALAREIGKEPVIVQDAPGFVANRLLIPMINEAIALLEQGVAGKEEIDAIMKLGASHPIGPLALADLVGLDICLAIMEVLHRDLGEDRYRPTPLLRRMVSAGYFGRKSGRGFYEYNH